MRRFIERTDSKYHLTGDSVPESVQSLSHATNCPVLDPDYLFFKRGAAQFCVPSLSDLASGGYLELDHVVYYLEQMDGSLAVYAHLHRIGVPVGCLYLGCVRSESWTSPALKER